MTSSPRRNPILLILGAIALIFAIWVVWTWAHWGRAGHGVDDSAEAVQGPPSSSSEATAVPAQPDNSGHDASGDAVARREDPSRASSQ